MKTSGPKSPNPRLVACLLVTTLSLLLSACASAYKVKVDALTSPKPEPTASYKIVNRNPHIETDSLRHKEVEKAVKTALSARGMYEAPAGTDADVIINVDYGISPPEIGQERRLKSIYSASPDNRPVSVPSAVPQEYQGERPYSVTVVNYEKYLRLSARENTPGSEEGKPAREIWAVDVTSKGQSNNLRQYIPIMAAAAIDYIGKDTSGEKSIWLEDDKAGDIAFVKKGPAPSPATGGNETAGRVPSPAPEPDKADRIPALPFATSSKS